MDYYTDTVFEVVSTNEASGSQATIFGGGRYDNLVKEMGGPEISGIGFAIGVERLLILCDAEEIFDIKNSLGCYVINLQFKSSERKNARFVLIIGEDEVKEGTITLKDTLTKAQESVKRDELTDRLDQLMEDYYE